MRRNKSSWGKSTLGVFVVVWLSLALQPCVMALGSGEHGDCPHCPPEVSQHHARHETASHDMASHDMASHDMASHDMASMAMPCGASGDCDSLDEFNYDGRTAEVKAEKVEIMLALLPPAFEQQQAKLPCRARSTRDSDHLSGAAPPIHVLNCVYLD